MTKHTAQYSVISILSAQQINCSQIFVFSHDMSGGWGLGAGGHPSHSVHNLLPRPLTSEAIEAKHSAVSGPVLLVLIISKET